MSGQVNGESTVDLKTGVSEILSIIDQEREREIITRRFGLYDRRETLEQIGELLGITRERAHSCQRRAGEAHGRPKRIDTGNTSVKHIRDGVFL